MCQTQYIQYDVTLLDIIHHIDNPVAEERWVCMATEMWHVFSDRISAQSKQSINKHVSSAVIWSETNVFGDLETRRMEINIQTTHISIKIFMSALVQYVNYYM